MKGRQVFFIFLVFVLGLQGQFFCNKRLQKHIRSKINGANYKKNLFRSSTFPLTDERIITKSEALLDVAKYTLRYFQSMRNVDRYLVRSKILEKGIITQKEAEDTLRFIIKTIEEDQKKKRKFCRLENPKFLKKHFSFIQWHGDERAARKNQVSLPKWYDEGKLKAGKIKLTSYALFRKRGNYYKTEQFPCALYEMVSDEFLRKIRFRYSKQKVLEGIFEKKAFVDHVRPMVWLSRENLEEALMQGSLITIMPNGRKRLFNAFKSNGFRYDKRIKNRRNQKKYWFFKEIKGKEYPEGRQFLPFLKFGGVAFAGDVFNLGLGKIIALRYQNPHTKKSELRLGVLADRGSAFSNNLYQLDLFAGIFNSDKKFKQFISQFPPSVTAYILKKKG